MEWTNEQKSAIDKRGSNILVSAGAGSGKTAVLSERILEYCKMGNDIRNVLVLTFSNAAAFEMKDRIRKKLIENNLLEQASYIDSAYITTFDSYCLSLVKRYYYKLGIGKNISIMDSSMSNFKLKEIANSLFLEKYEAKDEDFFKLLLTTSNKTDEFLLSNVLALCKEFEKISDLDSFVNNYEANYFNDEMLKSIHSNYQIVIKKTINDFILEILKFIEIVDEFDNIRNAASKLLNIIKVSGIEEYKAVLDNFKLPSFPKGYATDELKKAKTKFNDVRKNVLNKINIYFNKDQFISDILSIKPSVLKMIELAYEIINRSMKYKMSINRFTFSDIANLAIKLVTEFDDVNKEVKNQYKEILVDEYQDTSDMQEAFLNAIENNNRYMVGDIKQGIYRFREANPYLFKSKYINYSSNNGGIKIDLTNNYRSRCEVLEAINELFEILMTNDRGDAEYRVSHKMIYGQKKYENEKQAFNYDLEYITYTHDNKSLLTKAEEEAFIIGHKIKEIMKSKVKVLKKDGFEELDYNSFAILISQSKEFPVFKKVLEYLGIPVTIEASLDLKDSLLPNIFANILICISKILNKKYDNEFNHAKASIGRSFLFEYDDQTIYNMIVNKEKTELDSILLNLAYGYNSSYGKLFDTICSDVKIFERIALIGNVDDNLILINKLREIFVGFSDNLLSLDEAVDFLNFSLNDKNKIEYVSKSSAKTSVTIMTMHKSKGLEFAYCFYPTLSANFIKIDQKAKTGYYKDFGIYLPKLVDGKEDTPLQEIISTKIGKESNSERIRLWYVALTRAKEKIILVSDDEEYKNPINPDNFNSFKDFIEYCGVYEKYKKHVDINDYNPTLSYKLNGSKRTSGGSIELKYDEPKIYNKLLKGRISKEVKKPLTNSELKAIDLGNKMHEALEALDLENPNIDLLNADPFIKKTLIRLFENPLFKEIKGCKQYHEHEFYFINDGIEYHGIIDLMLVYDDKIRIVDYKLSNVEDDAYIKQLGLYYQYAKSISTKPIELYLLSILTGTIKRIDI